MNLTIDTEATLAAPVASTSTATPTPVSQLVPNYNYATSSSRLRSDVSVLDGLERVWRDWFDPLSQPPTSDFSALALDTISTPRRVASLRTLEVESMTTTIATYPSIPLAPGAPFDREGVNGSNARAMGHRFAAEVMGDGQRLFEMSWRDLECDVARIVVALEDAEQAKSVTAWLNPQARKLNICFMRAGVAPWCL